MPRSTAYPVVGLVYYNGYTFKDPLKAKITATYIPDSSGRTTKFVRYRLEIEAYVFGEDDIIDYNTGVPTIGVAGSAINDHLEDIRRKLAFTGGWLIAEDIGFGGNVDINNPTSGNPVIDVAFGPKPQILAWTPIGSDRAAKILWVCDFTIPECTSEQPNYAFSLSEYNYEMVWSIDNGITTRTASGQLSVPNYRFPFGSRTILDTADAYRDFVINHFTPIEGFHRNYNFRISSDKATLFFTVTDTEIQSDYAYPSYIVNIDVEHTVASRSASRAAEGVSILNGVLWDNSMRGTITVAPGFPKALAWEAFRLLVSNRVSMVIGQNDDKPNRLQYISNLSISNSLFNRRIRFDISFYMVASMETFMEFSGIFRPVTGTTWGQWSASMYDAGVTHERGIAGLSHLPQDDIIIDLCEAVPPNPPANPFKPYSDGFAFLPNQCPEANRSWIDFKNTIELHTLENGRYVHKKLRNTSTVSQDLSGWTRDPPLQDNQNATTNNLSPETPIEQSEPNLVQIKSPPTYVVVMKGYGRRQCYDVVIPRLVSFGGVTPIRGYQRVKPMIEVFHPTIPVKYAEWELQYFLPSPPDLGVLNDIIVETDGNYSTTRI
jgi:hypothetical protein